MLKRSYLHLNNSISIRSAFFTSGSDATASSTSKQRKQETKSKPSARPPRSTPGEEPKATKVEPAKVLTAPRELPTRHSRHQKPSVAPVESLETECQKLINAPPGTLFGTLYVRRHVLKKMTL